jgi:hypothetical protein
MVPWFAEPNAEACAVLFEKFKPSSFERLPQLFTCLS